MMSQGIWLNNSKAGKSMASYLLWFIFYHISVVFTWKKMLLIFVSFYICWPKDENVMIVSWLKLNFTTQKSTSHTEQNKVISEPQEEPSLPNFETVTVNHHHHHY